MLAPHPLSPAHGFGPARGSPQTDTKSHIKADASQQPVHPVLYNVASQKELLRVILNVSTNVVRASGKSIIGNMEWGATCGSSRSASGTGVDPSSDITQTHAMAAHGKGRQDGQPHALQLSFTTNLSLF